MIQTLIILALVVAVLCGLWHFGTRFYRAAIADWQSERYAAALKTWTDEHNSKTAAKRKGNRYVPKPGHGWNPLTSFPRNALCFCNSGRKAKRCCLPQIAHACPKKDVRKLADYMADLLETRALVQDLPPQLAAKVQAGLGDQAPQGVVDTPKVSA